MATQNFKLFLGCLGNGVTVCNSAVMENGDFKMVAHISVEGKITWYVSEDYPPADALASIRACAEQERVKHQAWLELGCGGQFFTTGVKLFRRRGRWYAYHFVSVDM